MLPKYLIFFYRLVVPCCSGVELDDELLDDELLDDELLDDVEVVVVEAIAFAFMVLHH